MFPVQMLNKGQICRMATLQKSASAKNSPNHADKEQGACFWIVEEKHPKTQNLYKFHGHSVLKGKQIPNLSMARLEC